MKRFYRLTLPLLFSMVFSSCAHIPQGYRSQKAPHIKIVKTSELAELQLESKTSSLNFGKREDGTKVIEEFLKKQQSEGGQYVTDLSLTLINEKDGKWESCTTSYTPEGETSVIPERQYTPSQTKMTYVSKPVTRMVTDYEYRCHSVQKSYTAYETVYEYQYDYTTKSSRSVPRSRPVTRYRSEQECRSEPVTHLVTRYESQLQSEYVPPRWDTVLRSYTTWKLIETQPSCLVMDSAPADLEKPHIVQAQVYSKSK